MFGWEIKPADEASADYVVEKNFALSNEEQALFDELVNEFKEESRAKEFTSRKEALECLWTLLKKLCSSKRLLLPKTRAQVITEAAELTLLGLGPIDLLLADDSIEEIALASERKPLFVYKRSVGWLKTNCFITSSEYALELVNKMARPLGRRLTMQSPRLNAMLASGERLHASIPPVALDGLELSLRKFKREPFGAHELAGNKTLSFNAAAAISLAVFADANIAVVGNTGSGKTTLLNALFSFIPLRERIVVTEETPELSLPHEHVARVVANKELNVSLSELVQDTLRMRPDRVVIGEVRGHDEAQALFDALLAGQARGTFFTLHARSPREAISRLASLGACKEEINAIDLIIAIRRIPRFSRELGRPIELRRVTEIFLNSACSGKTLYSLDSKGDVLCSHSIASLFERVSASYELSGQELAQELTAREVFSRASFEHGLSFNEFTLGFQKTFLGGE